MWKRMLKTTYGFTLCFLTVGLIWVYHDVKVPHTRKRHTSLYIADTLRAHNFTPALDRVPSLRVTRLQAMNIRNQTLKSILINHINITTNQSGTPTRIQFVTTDKTETFIKSRVHIIAIVSYMRSGSTLTGDILQHFPATVYVFEPFHTVIRRIEMAKPLYYLNGTVKKLKKEDITDDFLIEELHKWFNCRYEDLDIQSLADDFHAHFSRTMRKLANCWRPKRRTLKSMRECVPAIVAMCKAAKHRLFKFIRLPMRIIERVSGLYPNMQVIHLIRDPRGSLSSQIKVKKFTWETVDVISQDLCQRITADLNTSLYLNHFLPKRNKVLLYEHLAINPLEVAKRIYEYVGLPAYGYVMRYISKLTLEGKTDSTSFGIIRGNSTKTAFSWRNYINFTNVVKIDKNCRSVYHSIGYQSFASVNDVRNHFLETLITPNMSILI